MSAKFPPVDRSEWVVIYFQASGLCEALRLAVQTGQKPGKATIELIRKCREDAKRYSRGDCYDRLPEVDEDSPAIDLLVAAEMLRTTHLAFMSPQDIEENKQTFSMLSSWASPVGNFIGSAVKSVMG